MNNFCVSVKYVRYLASKLRWTNFEKFKHKFSLRLFRRNLQSTEASRDKNKFVYLPLGALDEVILASGAHWYRDAKGCWLVGDPQVPEIKPLVVEFLNWLNISKGISFEHLPDSTCSHIRYLQACIDLGLGLSDEDLDEANQTEKRDRNFQSPTKSK